MLLLDKETVPLFLSKAREMCFIWHFFVEMIFNGFALIKLWAHKEGRLQRFNFLIWQRQQLHFWSAKMKYIDLSLHIWTFFGPERNWRWRNQSATHLGLCIGCLVQTAAPAVFGLCFPSRLSLSRGKTTTTDLHFVVLFLPSLSLDISDTARRWILCSAVSYSIVISL